MNNAENFPVDIDSEIAWLRDHKAALGISWKTLGERVGRAGGTLSTFISGHYAGNKEEVARGVFRYRQMLESQAENGDGVPSKPGYFETPTSRRLIGLLIWAHRGRMTLAATAPGMGKSVTIAEYRASASNVWVATMEESTKSPNAMMYAVLRALGVTAKGGWGSQLSQLVKDAVRGRQGLLVIDEANHLTYEALEQLRAWHDATGVGICLMGNEELLMRIEGGRRRDAYARLNSRIAQRHLAVVPEAGDVAAFCDAWGIDDEGMRALLKRIALTPGAGGLRECEQIIEQASLLAVEDNRALNLSDLRDAQSQRATRHILV